jgi:uncharacterized protein (TIGR02265 family)
MPVDQQDLQARMAATTPEDTVRGLIFNALFDTVEAHASKAAAHGCDVAGKGRRTDFLSYPVKDFLACAGRAVDLLEPRLGSVERAFFEVGYRTLANVLGSALGATIIVMARRDPRALLVQAPTAYRGMVSYGERRLEWLGPTRARLTFRRDFMLAAYHRGVLMAAVESIGVRNPQVTGAHQALLDATYEVSWDA